MKIFAVYFKIELTKKPEWFDEFLEKYRGSISGALHVTLIQPRYIDETEIPVVKNKITKVLQEQHFLEEDKKIIFDELVSGLESDGTYVYMLATKKNNQLMNFQKALRDALIEYENYYDAIMRGYEIDFKPHLTLGNSIAPDQKAETDHYFSSDYTCEGYITKLVLPVVKDMSIAEANNKQNLTIFHC